MSTITDFVKENASVKPNADIVERWESRIVAQGLHQRGADGANAYLGKYGKGLKSPKAVSLARIAEIKGCHAMASRFWEEAYFLATGQRASLVTVEMGTPSHGVTLPAPTVKTGFICRPQLLTPLTEAEAIALALNPAYCVQEKFDGRRLEMSTDGGPVTGGNKKGLAGIAPLPFADALRAAVNAQGGGLTVTDGEDTPDTYHTFDLLFHKGEDIRQMPYEARHALLTSLFADAPSPAVHVVPLGKGSAKEKLAFIESIRARGGEGFVVKLLNAPHTEGDAHEAQWKFQFRATNAFIVGARNGAKSSVAISVRRADGSIRDMGNLTIPGKTPIPEMGSVVEVEYLYCHPGATGKLHQPVFKGVRDDADAADCTEAKLKVKATGADE